MAAYQFGVGEYETENGRKAEVIAIRNGALIGTVEVEAYIGGIAVRKWNASGECEGVPAHDLLPPKQTRTVWINIYPAGTSDACALHLSEELARLGRGDKTPTHALACLKVDLTFTPGEGLDK